MILSGQKILEEVSDSDGSIKIRPFDPSQIGPNSYDVRLASTLLTYEDVVLDMKKKPRVSEIEIPPEGFELKPNKLYLAKTVEYTETYAPYVPMLEGRSSIGRLGLCIHITAGFGDVGFRGAFTLEMFCQQPLRIYAGVRIGQLYYLTLQGESDSYAGKYSNDQGQGPIESKLWKELQESNR